jgi:hypothetical protein
MGQPTASAESSLFYDLPVAYYRGARAPDLARRYDGASRLVRFAVGSALGLRPEMRVQAEGWARRGALDMAVGYVGAEIGHLLVSFQVKEHGHSVVLGTVQDSAITTLENWDAHWTEGEPGGFIVSDASHRTVRATESFNYAGEVPVLNAPIEGAQLAAVGSVGLRAAIAFRRYHDQLVAGVTTGETIVQSVHFKPPDAP